MLAFQLSESCEVLGHPLGSPSMNLKATVSHRDVLKNKPHKKTPDCCPSSKSRQNSVISCQVYCFHGNVFSLRKD